jgi:hypothetical protein
MKHTLRLVFALAVAALAPFARAESHVVAALTTASVSTIIIPGGGPGKILWVSISNATTANGGNQVNITVDGGTANGLNGTDPATGATGVAAVWLQPGQTVVLWGPYVAGVPIRAIMATGTTVLTVGTNAATGTSSFPTN